MGVGSGSALCTWLSAADLTQMENFAIAFPLKNACSPPHLFSPFPITKPSPGCSLEPTPMTPPAAQPCANTRGTTQARLLQLVAGHHPLLPLGVNWFARLRKWEGQYVHLINLKMKYAALMEVAEQLNRIEPSASGKSQNNWNCKPRPLGSTAKWARASDFFLWTDSFPNSGLFQAWASPRQGPSGHQIHDKLHISETNLQFKMKTTVRKIDDSQGWVHGKGVKSWGATRIFPGQWFPGARGHAGLMIPINLDIWAPLPTQRPGQRSGSPPETFCWSRLKPRSSPFWQINGFHWRISLSSISFREGRRQELRFGLLLMSDQTLDVFTHHLPVESQGRRIPAWSCSVCQGKFQQSRLCPFGKQNGKFYHIHLLPVDHEDGPSAPLLPGAAALWKRRWTSLFMAF